MGELDFDKCQRLIFCLVDFFGADQSGAAMWQAGRLPRGPQAGVGRRIKIFVTSGV